MSDKTALFREKGDFSHKVGVDAQVKKWILSIIPKLCPCYKMKSVKSGFETFHKIISGEIHFSHQESPEFDILLFGSIIEVLDYSMSNLEKKGEIEKQGLDYDLRIRNNCPTCEKE